MWFSTVRTDNVNRVAISRLDSPCPISITISRSRSVSGSRSAALRRVAVRAPHCSANASALAEQPNADPRKSLCRYAMAACAAASTAAIKSPISSNSADTDANSAPSSSCNASAKRAARPARGPSTIAASSRNRGPQERSPNCVAVCKHITSGANCPFDLAVSAAASETAIASLMAPCPAASHALAIAYS